MATSQRTSKYQWHRSPFTYPDGYYFARDGRMWFVTRTPEDHLLWLTDPEAWDKPPYSSVSKARAERGWMHAVTGVETANRALRMGDDPDVEWVWDTLYPTADAAKAAAEKGMGLA